MSLGRRLLMSSGGSGSFTPPGPTYMTLVPIPDAGALLAQNYPNAVYYNGVTYFGYNDGDQGNITVRTYTHATGVTSGPTVVHASLEIETHNPPSLLMRASDHRLMVFYMKHSGSVAYLKVATDPESIASFGAAVNLHTSIGASDYTYPTVHQLTGLANDPIYLFFRDGNTAGTPGTQAWLTYSVSTDDGATWSAKTYVHKPTTKRPYWMVRGNGLNRIDVFLCEDDRAFNDNVAGAHCYFDGTTWRGSDGTSLGALPLAYSAMTEVYPGTAGSVDPMDIAWTTDGRPVVTWRLWKPTAPTGGTDSYFAVWSGSAWTTTRIVVGGDECYLLDTSPLVVYLRRLVSGAYEVWRYTSTNEGVSWSSIGVYTGTTDDLTYLTPVRDYGTGLAVIWSEGTYVSATNFDFGISGAG